MKTAGEQAEALAEAFLRRQGFRILGRNMRSRFGEVDVVAEEKGTLCFVEVRARKEGAMVSALESITPHKQRRLALTAQSLLRRHPEWQHYPARFDVVTVVLNGWRSQCELIRNAFSLDD